MTEGDLYSLPLQRFIPERTALARTLRAEGRREDAARVAKLRKPSAAAWAVNQLVRTRASEIAELFDAGDGLRQTQADVVAGRGEGRELRAAAARERAAVDALVSAAGELLSSEEHEMTSGMIDRITDTLRAAAREGHARATVREGRLERELRHSGLGVDLGVTTTPAAGRAGGPATSATKPKAAAGDRQPLREEREREAQLREQARRIERERAEAHRAARAAESDARRRADQAARASRNAQSRRERAADALQQAEEALTTAREEAQAAAEAHHLAQQALSES
jgi:hypothetical protein